VSAGRRGEALCGSACVNRSVDGTCEADPCWIWIGHRGRDDAPRAGVRMTGIPGHPEVGR